MCLLIFSRYVWYGLAVTPTVFKNDWLESFLEYVIFNHETVIPPTAKIQGEGLNVLKIGCSPTESTLCYPEKQFSVFTLGSVWKVPLNLEIRASVGFTPQVLMPTSA